VKRFQILEPRTVAEASRMLQEHGDAARIYAGGTELLLVLKERLLHYDYLVNIKTIPGLGGIDWDQEAGEVRIGALATHREIERSPVIAEYVPLLAEVEKKVANVRVRNVGTLAGNLCFAEPHADPGTVLLLHDARVVLETATERRELPLAEFFIDALTVALEPGEILTEIRVPRTPPGAGAAYTKFGHLERPMVGVGVLLQAREGTIIDARVAVGCAGPTPRRMPEAEEILRGAALARVEEQLAAAGEAAAAHCDAVDDLHGTAEYKRHLVQVLVGRVARQALQRIKPIA